MTDPNGPIKPLHKMTEAQVRREIEAMELEFVGRSDVLPLQHILFFAKPAPPPSPSMER